jgi:Uma2 family endonuclease
MSLVADLEPLLDQSPIRIRLANLTDKTFTEFCRHNPDLRVELDAEGTLIVMSPTFSDTGMYSGRLFRQLDEYCERTGSGYAFDSSTGFTLPNGAKRSPDASWISSARWEALSNAQQNSYANLCPDVVMELMSTSDSLMEAQNKMLEYQVNGAMLGFLIDRKARMVYVYRPDAAVEHLKNPSHVSAESAMAGFELAMARIF